MIKIKLHEYDIHRNETTFRPLVMIRNELRDVGVELVVDAASYDFTLVGQASIANKKLPLDESVDFGLATLKKIDGDYIIIDGQDAPTLIGTADVLRHVYKDKRCKLFLKSSYYKDFDMYKKEWALGRMYWGYDRPGPDQLQSRYGANYSVPDIDDMKHKMKLAGFNWLSTVTPNWNMPGRGNDKYNDISAMFQFPMGKDIYEHGHLQSYHYDNFRRGLVDKLEVLENKYNVARIINGVRIPQDQYYEKMKNSKIVIAPFGYGEMAPRDIESSMFGSVLLKNDMSHIDTIPNIYIDRGTYMAIKWDWSDLEKRIDEVLSNWPYWVNHLATQMQTSYEAGNCTWNRVLHIHNLLKNLDGIGVE